MWQSRPAIEKNRNGQRAACVESLTIVRIFALEGRKVDPFACVVRVMTNREQLDLVHPKRIRCLCVFRHVAFRQLHSLR